MTRQVLLIVFGIAALGLNGAAAWLTRHDTPTDGAATPRPPPNVRGCLASSSQPVEIAAQ